MERWCAARGVAKGALLDAAQCWQLARLWYRGRAEPEWERPAPDAVQALFEGLGLTGPFWAVTSQR